MSNGSSGRTARVADARRDRGAGHARVACTRPRASVESRRTRCRRRARTLLHRADRSGSSRCAAGRADERPAGLVVLDAPRDVDEYARVLYDRLPRSRRRGLDVLLVVAPPRDRRSGRGGRRPGAAAPAEQHRQACRRLPLTDHMSRDARPIGVFDSGLGGLTVVRALIDLLPDERRRLLRRHRPVPVRSEAGRRGPEVLARDRRRAASSAT